MLVNLAYGRSGLTVEFPDEQTTVIEPAYVQGLPNQPAAIAAALADPLDRPPLSDLVGSDQTVAISVCDVTRPMPSATVLPVVLQALSHLPTNNITILISKLNCIIYVNCI